nr:MAG TPA: hypothetical protein [Caudoviricetes sp.]
MPGGKSRRAFLTVVTSYLQFIHRYMLMFLCFFCII